MKLVQAALGSVSGSGNRWQPEQYCWASARSGILAGSPPALPNNATANKKQRAGRGADTVLNLPAWLRHCQAGNGRTLTVGHNFLKVHTPNSASTLAVTSARTSAGALQMNSARRARQS